MYPRRHRTPPEQRRHPLERRNQRGDVRVQYGFLQYSFLAEVGEAAGNVSLPQLSDVFDAHDDLAVVGCRAPAVSHAPQLQGRRVLAAEYQGVVPLH